MTIITNNNKLHSLPHRNFMRLSNTARYLVNNKYYLFIIILSLIIVLTFILLYSLVQELSGFNNISVYLLGRWRWSLSFFMRDSKTIFLVYVWNIVQVYLFVLCFIVLLTNGRFVATLCPANLSVPFFQQHLLLSLWLCFTFW